MAPNGAAQPDLRPRTRERFGRVLDYLVQCGSAGDQCQALDLRHRFRSGVVTDAEIARALHVFAWVTPDRLARFALKRGPSIQRPATAPPPATPEAPHPTPSASPPAAGEETRDADGLTPADRAQIAARKARRRAPAGPPPAPTIAPEDLPAWQARQRREAERMAAEEAARNGQPLDAAAGAG